MIENLRDLTVTRACTGPGGHHYALTYHSAGYGRIRDPLFVPLGGEMPDLSHPHDAIGDILDRVPAGIDRRRTLALAVLRKCILDVEEESPRTDENGAVWELAAAYLIAAEDATPIPVERPNRLSFNEKSIGIARAKVAAGRGFSHTISLPSANFEDVTHVVQLTGSETHAAYGAVHGTDPEVIVNRHDLWDE